MTDLKRGRAGLRPALQMACPLARPPVHRDRVAAGIALFIGQSTVLRAKRGSRLARLNSTQQSSEPGVGLQPRPAAQGGSEARTVQPAAWRVTPASDTSLFRPVPLDSFTAAD